MIVRFDQISGNIINIVNNEHFVQGDTNTHDIDVIFDIGFDNTNYNAYIQFLRQGETKPSPKLVMTPKVITYNNETYRGYSFKVQTDWYTAIAGTLKATIEIKEYNDDGLQSNKAYGIINIPIEDAVDDNPQVVSTITDEEYLALINLVNSKLNIVDEKVHLIEDTTIASYSQFVDACIAHKTTYNTTRIYLGHVSSQPIIALVDQNDDVTIISSTGVIKKITRDGVETNITLKQVKVDSLKVERSFESSGNFKAGQAQFTGLVTFDDRIYSNAITTEHLTAMNTSYFYGTTTFNNKVLLQNIVTLGNDGIFDATHGNIKIKDVPLLNISDSSWSNYPTSVKTMLDYVANQINAIETEIQNGTITEYGAQYDNAGNQFLTYYLKYIDVVDDLTSLETQKPLSAYQGKRLKDMINAIQAIISSDDVNLDTIQEIVNYIKNNKADIDEFLATKVNISDIIDNLNSTLTNKPLSANQGRVLKELIDAIVNGTTTVANKGYVDSKIEEVNNKLSNIGNVSELQTTDKSSLVNAINECVDSIDDINCDKDINNSTYWVVGNFDSGIVMPNKTPLRAITVNPIPSNVKVITCDDGYGMQIAVRDNNNNPLGYYDCNDDLIDQRSITNFAKVFYPDILPSNYKIYIMVRPSDGSVGKIEDWKHCHLYVDNSVNKEELYNRFYEGKPIDLKKNGFYSCSLFDLNDIGVTTSGAPQDIAIYNDKLFCVYNKGELAIVDLKTSTLVNKFNLSCYSENTHANTMCFGTKFNSSDDTYPLLYVSESNTPNNYCYVVKITESGSETIQTIKFTNGNNDYKGRIYYLIDDLTGYMYTYGSTITNPAMNPNNKIMIKKFNTPDLSIESVEITENDVLEEWYLEDTLISGNTIIQSIQGATIHNGVLYLLDGNTSSKRTLFVFDLCTHEMLSKLSLDYIQYEPEGISIYEDKIIISFYVGSGRLYSFKFN